MAIQKAPRPVEINPARGAGMAALCLVLCIIVGSTMASWALLIVVPVSLLYIASAGLNGEWNDSAPKAFARVRWALANQDRLTNGSSR